LHDAAVTTPEPNKSHGRKPAIPLIDAGAAFKRAARERIGQDRLI
jgi:hypothetical protein